MVSDAIESHECVTPENPGHFLQGLRNMAIVALASNTMLRAPDIAALDVTDFDAEANDEFGRLNIRKSKTDQEGRRNIALHLAPSTVRHVRAWLDAAGLSTGSLFCSMRRGGYCTNKRLSVRSTRNIIVHMTDTAVETYRHISPDRQGDLPMGMQICFHASEIDLQYIEDIRGARGRPELSATQIIRAALESFAERELDRAIARMDARENNEQTEGCGRDGDLTAAPAMDAKDADKFRAALLRHFRSAEKAGRWRIQIVSRDLHREVGGYPGVNHQMSLCCRVMEDEMGEGDAVITRPRARYGARLTIRYRIPRPIQEGVTLKLKPKRP